jgi:hypothetical protein
MLTVFVLLRICSLCSALTGRRKRPPGLPGADAPGNFMAPLRGPGGPLLQSSFKRDGVWTVTSRCNLEEGESWGVARSVR